MICSQPLVRLRFPWSSLLCEIHPNKLHNGGSLAKHACPVHMLHQRLVSKCGFDHGWRSSPEQPGAAKSCNWEDNLVA